MKNKFASSLAVTAALSIATIAAHAEAPFSFAATPGKLPKDVLPIQYAAHLIPNLASNTFLGSESIEIDVVKSTSTIMLNVANIDIDSARLSGSGITELTLKPEVSKEQETLTFKLAAPLAPGRYQLALKFHGSINREARGLFQLKYKAGASDKSLLATNMEPTDTRRLLPTWDEPAFRASFKLTVDLPANFKAYSNTPVEKQEKIEGGLQRIAFGPTPKMASYLLVLVAGELERSSVKQGGVEIGVVTTEGKQPQGAYALGVTKDILKYYNGYFGQPFPLPKLDQIAIPGGFNGAMENWGGIVYNETALLFDPKTSPESTRQLSFSVNAHEVAHQWFGNLVTMAWWDNLWLNEGFASWMATKATDHFHPEWRAPLESLTGREHVMNLDARKTTHPIQTPITSEEQAASAFDGITYGKGEAFLRMLEAYLGEEPFRKGIRNYMAQHQYSNTTSANLWSALEKASGKPVEKLASDWTTMPGFPLVSVEQACENGKRRVTLSQQQYRLDEPATAKQLWNIPVQVGTVNGKAAYTLLSGPSVTINQPNCDGALVIDPASVGYFRIKYDTASFDALAQQAAKLPDTTRLKLLADTWSLAQGGTIALDGYFKLLGKYADEPRYAVWSAMADSLFTLDALAKDEPEQASIRRFVISLTAPRMSKLGWEVKPGDSAEERQLRSLLAAMLANAGDATAIAHANSALQRYLKDPAAVDVSMLDFVIGSAGRNADQETYEQMVERTLQTQNTEERSRIGSAVLMAKDPALAARSLKMALSDALPAAMTSRVVPMVAQAGHRDMAWTFALANREALLKDQESAGKNRLFPSLVSSSTNLADADKMEAYVKQNFGPDAQVDAARAANAVRTRVKQKQALLPQVRTALK